MRLYNTLSRQVEELKPPPAAISMYSCGPTVYDYSHIGNLRAFVFVDTLRRSLELSGYQVKHVMNITDVGHLSSDADEGEDKLEKGAKREGKTVWQVAEFYTDIFKQNVSSLNILPPNAYRDQNHDDTYARATGFIKQQKEIIQLLLDKGFAYMTKTAIYFDVAKLPGYGELSGQRLQDQEVAVRPEVFADPEKHHPQDFAVWFFTIGRFSRHSMRWPSPWGEGFPGWHLECSAIIHAVLGDPIDIHTGGVDHIGTHHTNEIAQTKAAFGNDLARLWLHNEFMLVNGKKMSKSLGNFLTLEDITKRGYTPASLRLLFFQSHYRSQVNFTWEALEGAQNRLNMYQSFADLRFQLKQEALSLGAKVFRKLEVDLTDVLQDDLSTSAYLARLDEFIDRTTAAIHPHDESNLLKLLKFIDSSTGLKLLGSEDITEDQKNLISQRDSLRASRKWNEADKIRKELSGSSIELKDTQQGSIWYRPESTSQQFRGAQIDLPK